MALPLWELLVVRALVLVRLWCLNQATPLHPGCSFDSSNGKVFVTFSQNNDSNKGQAIVGTVSGTSISFGTKVQYTANEVFGNKSVYDSENGKVVITLQRPRHLKLYASYCWHL